MVLNDIDIAGPPIEFVDDSVVCKVLGVDNQISLLHLFYSIFSIRVSLYLTLKLDNVSNWLKISEAFA